MDDNYVGVHLLNYGTGMATAAVCAVRDAGWTEAPAEQELVG